MLTRYIKNSGSDTSLIIGLVIVLNMYSNSESFIENQNWQYSDGTHIGDCLGKNKF